MGRPNSFINQHLDNLIINEQFSIWDKNKLHNYKMIYLASKAWPLLKLQEFLISQPLIPCIKEKINTMDNEGQQTMTPGLAKIGSIPLICQELITSYLANALGSIFLIRQLTITFGPAQIGSIPPPNWS